jgi:hypothetical protein
MRRIGRVMAKCVGNGNLSLFSFDVDAGHATYVALPIAAARRYAIAGFA